MNEVETEVVEYPGFVLEDQILDHLATPEGAMAIWKERITPEMVDTDEAVAETLAFVIDYIDQYRQAPDVSVIAQETGFEDFQVPTAPVGYVIDKLKERHTRKAIKQVVTKLTRKMDDPREALNYGFGALGELIRETTDHSNELSSHDFLAVLDRYEQKVELGRGVTFGYDEVDAALNGMHKGQLSFCVARPGRYKSWHVAVKAAAEAFMAGQNILVATCEMTDEEVQDRQACYMAGMPWVKFKHNILPKKEKADLAELATWTAEQPNFMKIINPRVGERTVPHLSQLAKEFEADALFVDQLSFLQATKEYRARHEEVASIVYQMKEAASELPIYCAAQLNREASSLAEMADLEHIGLSDAVGQAADHILAIYSSKEMKESKILHLGSIKARDYDTSSWEVRVELTERSNFQIIGPVV